MKRMLAVAIFLITLHGWGETVQGLPKPTGYVSDVAHVLSAGEKEEMESQCTVIHEKTGTQVAVVTIHRLEDGMTAQEFAHGISDAWGVGSKGTDRGIVLLVVTEDRKRWIDVGYGLEGVLNDAKVGDIGRAMLPALKDGRFGEGLEVGVSQISDVLLAAPELSLGEAPEPKQSNTWLIMLFVIGLGGFGLAVVGMVVFIAKGTRRPRTASRSRRDEDADVGFLAGDTSSSNSSSFIGSSGSDSGSSSSDSGSSVSSGSDFSGFDGGTSGGGGAGGDF